VKTKSGSSAWGVTISAGLWRHRPTHLAAGQLGSRAGLHGRQRVQRAQRNVRLPF
jgi:hypothetical protein